MTKIIMTGGGTAGHVIVNTVLIERLLQLGWEVVYIGSYNGVEKNIINQISGVTYYQISTGKLRRYFSVENFKDIFKILKGIGQSYKLLKRIKPSVVFSCGGFVSVPIVVAAWLNKVGCIIRETDYSAGLANRICIPLSQKVCVTFKDTLRNMPNTKRIEIGPIIREELLKGEKQKGVEFTGITGKKPVIMVIGGSQGSEIINKTIRESLKDLIETFDVIHLCGNEKIDVNAEQDGYVQFEYVDKEMPHLYVLADVIVSRAGSNAVFEGMMLNKPMLLIPISRKVSRGDQIMNADYMKKEGCAEIILEEELNKHVLREKIHILFHNKSRYIKGIESATNELNINTQLNVIIDFQ